MTTSLFPGDSKCVSVIGWMIRYQSTVNMNTKEVMRWGHDPLFLFLDKYLELMVGIRPGLQCVFPCYWYPRLLLNSSLMKHGYHLYDWYCQTWTVSNMLLSLDDLTAHVSTRNRFCITRYQHWGILLFCRMFEYMIAFFGADGVPRFNRILRVDLISFRINGVYLERCLVSSWVGQCLFGIWNLNNFSTWNKIDLVQVPVMNRLMMLQHAGSFE